MKKVTRLLGRLRGLTNAIVRYPVTTTFLLAVAVIVAVSINGENNYEKYMLTCVVGAVLCAVLQSAYERFWNKISTRFILMGLGLALTLGYFLIIRPAPDLSMEISIRTWIAMLALFVAFIWIPVIRSRINFNESFMASFKEFFHSLFYSAVIFLGCSLIIMAIDTLIIPVNEKAYMHSANIIFVLFAPLFFLSLIPVYPGRMEKEIEVDNVAELDEKINKATLCPRFLEVLISYIIIPLTEIFSIILLVYIALNIRGKFWTDNLLEPMLVAYAITVILVYILCSMLQNKFAIWFRLVFPKVLVPIVLFQIVSSIISVNDTGITHTRYFVILFGIFAASAGIVMSLVPVRKNGIIAAMLIAFSVVSIIPPVDAFTVSRLSQENRLKTVLIENKMLENNAIKSNGSISDKDKAKIVSSVQYLDRMNYTDKISWFPEQFTAYDDFYDTFGFYEYELPENEYKNIAVFLNSTEPIVISGYDFFTRTFMNNDESGESTICTIKEADQNYTLIKEKAGDHFNIALSDDNKKQMISLNTDEIFSRYSNYAVDKTQLSNEEASFSVENDKAKLTIVVQEANINSSSNQTYYYADFYILVDFK